MNSTTLSATNKAENDKIVRKIRQFTKKMYGQYKTVDKIY